MCSYDAGSTADSKVKAAIVTDTGGVDDKSFNQSAWEVDSKSGVKLTNLKDSGLLTSIKLESDFANNIRCSAKVTTSSLVLVLPLHDAVSDAANEHEDVNYVIIDDVIKDQKNVERFVC
ncbi:MAG: BMP family ABC transporter substrate-binding protein [Streptococcus sp.]